MCDDFMFFYQVMKKFLLLKLQFEASTQAMTYGISLMLW